MRPPRDGTIPTTSTKSYATIGSMYRPRLPAIPQTFSLYWGNEPPSLLLTNALALSDTEHISGLL
jgi:hypothetical protein